MGKWNVTTLATGLEEDLKLIDDTCKAAVIDNELDRLNMDIVALQETRLLSFGCIREDTYTFFWQGKGPMEKRERGVGFAIRNALLNSITPPSNGSERILKIQLETTTGLVSLFTVYAPPLNSALEEKGKLYEDLEADTNDVPEQHLHYILCIFNARVGSDSTSWPVYLGQYGTGKLNENGQRLLEFCTAHYLCVTNTFFCAKPIHCVSWRHPRSKHWYQLDLVLMWHRSIGNVSLTKSFQSANSDTDHPLGFSTARLKPGKTQNIQNEWTKAYWHKQYLQHGKSGGVQPHTGGKIWRLTKYESLNDAQTLRDTVYTAVSTAFGVR